jgi:quinol monooxygenase YgiN
MTHRKMNTSDSRATSFGSQGSDAANVKITASLTARPNQAEALKALLFGMAPLCRAEPGNLRWDVWRDQSEPERYVLDELYVDDHAVSAHRETPHYKDYLARIGDLAERTALVLIPLEVEPAR